MKIHKMAIGLLAAGAAAGASPLDQSYVCTSDGRGAVAYKIAPGDFRTREDDGWSRNLCTHRENKCKFTSTEFDFFDPEGWALNFEAATGRYYEYDMFGDEYWGTCRPG